MSPSNHPRAPLRASQAGVRAPEVQYQQATGRSGSTALATLSTSDMRGSRAGLRHNVLPSGSEFRPLTSLSNRARGALSKGRTQAGGYGGVWLGRWKPGGSRCKGRCQGRWKVGANTGGRAVEAQPSGGTGVRRVRRRDIGPKVSTLMRPAANRRAIAAAKPLLVMPSARGSAAKDAGA